MKSLSFIDNLILKIPNNRYAYQLFCLIAFFESSFLPFPPDLVMLPMILANSKKTLKIIILGTIFSVLGGIFTYIIGAYFFESTGCWIIKTYNLSDSFHQIQKNFLLYGFWIISLKGLVPFVPYKLLALTSGMTGFSMQKFILASIIGRSSRFIFLGVMIHFFGPSIKDFIKKYPKLLILSFLFMILFLIILMKIFI